MLINVRLIKMIAYQTILEYKKERHFLKN